MRECARLMIGPYATIREAIAVIEKEAAQIALVADPAGRLLGTVTDGDVRRGMLDGLSLDQPVELVMNLSPVRYCRGHRGNPRMSLCSAKGCGGFLSYLQTGRLQAWSAGGFSQACPKG